MAAETALQVVDREQRIKDRLWFMLDTFCRGKDRAKTRDEFLADLTGPQSGGGILLMRSPEIADRIMRRLKEELTRDRKLIIPCDRGWYVATCMKEVQEGAAYYHAKALPMLTLESILLEEGQRQFGGQLEFVEQGGQS